MTRKKSSHGLGNITFRAGRAKPYIFRIMIDGEVHTESFATEKEALRAQRNASFKYEEQGRKPIKRVKVTVGDCVQAWIDTKIGIVPNVLERYELFIRLYLKTSPLWKKKLTELSLEDCRKFVKDFSDKGLSAAYIRDIVSVLNQPLEQAVLDGKLALNPMKYVKKPERTKTSGKAMSAEQVRHMLSTIRNDGAANRNYLVYVVALATGVRPSELISLKWRNLDWENGSILIADSIHREKGKGLVTGATKTESGVRSYPISDEVLAMLRKHRAQQNEIRLAHADRWEDNGLIFCTEPSREGTRIGGKPLDRHNLSRQWRRLREKAGLGEYRLYDCRHTSHTEKARLGYDLATIGKLAGHKDIRSTSVYVHPDSQMLRKAGIEGGKAFLLDEEIA